MNIVNNNLRQMRTRLGITQQALAEQAGISRQAYTAIESGRSMPSTGVALRLARILRTTVEALFSLADAPGETIEAELVSDAPAAAQSARVQLLHVGPRMLARPLLGTSASLHTLTEAEGTIAANSSGRSVSVRLLDKEAVRTPMLVLSGCDPTAAFLASSLREKGVRLILSERGSRDALQELARGEAHIAGCHLLDEDSGSYNFPWVARVVPFRCTLVSFAIWREGLIVATGNPKGILDVEHLARPDVTIVNRQPGSGSRMLLDRLLSECGIPASAVRGYDRQAGGHLGVAEAISQGLTDAGIGVEAAANAIGLDFIPLREERYDLVIPDHFLDITPVGALLNSLRQSKVRDQLIALGGYDATSMGLPASS
jgi:putative molybdopterin biosynthesis protein